MRMLTAIGALIGLTVLASAQTQNFGAQNFHAQLQNATPIAKQAACRGFGPHCPPGYTWTCGGYRGCWCRPCY
jgi:hypothetical protein